MEASWAILGILGHLGASWLAAYRVPAGHLGRLGGLLGASWGRLGPSWGVSWGILGRLGASGRRLRLDFLPKWNKIEPFHLESHFVFDV